jgi:Periplasmic binding protein/Resolvase, N terminal domain
VAADDGYEPMRAAESMKELYDKQQVFGFIGNVGTPTAVVALPYALERKALFFGAFTGAGLLRRDPPDRYVFNYRASYAEETDAVVRYLVKIRGVRPEQIAVFAQQDAYGDSGFAGVAKAMRALRGANEGAILRLDYKRNTVDVDDTVARLRDLFLHQQGLDTTTPAGKAMFQMLGVFAEFERSIIQERVRAGLQRAKREGKRLGRPPIADKLAERIRAALAGGMSVRKTAAKFDVNPSTVQRIARPFDGAEDANVAVPA